MSKPYCCDAMGATISAASLCVDARISHRPDECEDVSVMRKGKHFVIPKPGCHYRIKFCPWCGTKLSTIKRAARNRMHSERL